MECPKCNSENYKFVRKDWESGKGYNIDMQCLDCGFADFSKHYSHTVSYYGNFDPDLYEVYLSKESEEWKYNSEIRQAELGIKNAAWWENYRKYLLTDEWKKKRIYVLERDKHLCQMCLINKATQVHHTEYKHFGNELTCELISVCDRCHEIIHEKEAF